MEKWYTTASLDSNAGCGAGWSAAKVLSGPVGAGAFSPVAGGGTDGWDCAPVDVPGAVGAVLPPAVLSAAPARAAAGVLAGSVAALEFAVPVPGWPGAIAGAGAPPAESSACRDSSVLSEPANVAPSSLLVLDRLSASTRRRPISTVAATAGANEKLERLAGALVEQRNR